MIRRPSFLPCWSFATAMSSMWPTAPRLWMLQGESWSASNARLEWSQIGLQFPLNDEGASPDNGALCASGVLNDDDVVTASSSHLIILLLKVGLADLADSGQDAQAVKEATVKVGLSQGAQSVADGQSSLDLLGKEVGAEEAFLSHGGVDLAGFRGVDRGGRKEAGSEWFQGLRDRWEAIVE